MLKGKSSYPLLLKLGLCSNLSYILFCFINMAISNINKISKHKKNIYVGATAFKKNKF